MKMKRMVLNEKKMNEECEELIDSKNLTTCKPKGVGVFSSCDGPPAAGGGIGMFLWFKDWQEMYQFLANYFVACGPGLSEDDHEPVDDRAWEIFNELAKGKNHRGAALG